MRPRRAAARDRPPRRCRWAPARRMPAAASRPRGAPASARDNRQRGARSIGACAWARARGSAGRRRLTAPCEWRGRGARRAGDRAARRRSGGAVRVGADLLRAARQAAVAAADAVDGVHAVVMAQSVHLRGGGVPLLALAYLWARRVWDTTSTSTGISDCESAVLHAYYGPSTLAHKPPRIQCCQCGESVAGARHTVPVPEGVHGHGRGPAASGCRSDVRAHVHVRA